jgi:drug/metabolite transporter (DMT)-like permease
MARDRLLLLGTLSALGAASLFGMLGPLSRIGAQEGVDALSFTAWRAMLGMAFLAVLIVGRRGVRSSLGSVRALDGHGRAALTVAAAMSLLLNAAMFSAFSLIPIALALMLFYTYPAGVAVVDVGLGHERLTPSRLAALALSTCGAILVLAGSMDTTTAASVDTPGILLALSAAAGQVAFISVSRTGYRSVPADAATVVILAVALSGAVSIAIVLGNADGLTAPLRNPAAWPALLAGGVLAAGVASVLFLRAIRLVGGTRTGILMLFEPVVGVTLAAIWLGETLVPVQLLGGVLVLAGAAVLQLRSAPDHETVIEAGASPAM